MNAPEDRALEVRTALEARAANEQGIVDGLESYVRACAEGSQEREAARAALAVAKLHLARTRKALGLVRAALDAYAQRQERESAEFAREWIVIHGISRGMPHGWESRLG